MADLEPVPAMPEEVAVEKIEEAPVVEALAVVDGEVLVFEPPKVPRISADGVVLSKCEFSREGVILKVLEE